MLIQAALKQACRENRGQARGSVSGAGWEIADRAAEKASRSGDWRGYRDAAIIRITSDAILPDVEDHPLKSGFQRQAYGSRGVG